MAWDTDVQSQVDSDQRLKKLYFMPPCLTLIIIRYGLRVSGIIQRKEKLSSLHLGVVAIEKGAFESPLTTVGQLLTYSYLRY